MSEQDFDNALITAAFRLAAEVGWARVTVAEAARMAGLSLAEARVRFPAKHSLLLRFRQRLDQAALSAATGEGPVRDRLFDLLMCRFDGMKPHREGIAALLRLLPTDPATTLLLACSTRRGMRWMLHAAGQPLPLEPGCRLCQDVALLTQAMVLTSKAAPVPPARRLSAHQCACRHPARLASPRVKSTVRSAPNSRASSSGVRPDRTQIDHLSPELRRISWFGSGASDTSKIKLQGCPANRVNSIIAIANPDPSHFVCGR